MKLYKRLYENSIDDFFDEDSEEETYYEESLDTKELIDEWLKEYCDIDGTYIINNDNSIDVDGNILILGNIESLPSFINFNEVKGNFDINYFSNDRLISLKGSPKKCRNYYCSKCKKLESLEGAPIEVENIFNCSENPSLKSLKYSPKKVDKFECFQCNSLISLEGAPEKVETFDCTFCISLKTLEGCPKYLKSLDCSHCKSLKNLKGIPNEIFGSFDCSYCPIETLEGSPEFIYGNFYCYSNEFLKSLKGGPKYVEGNYDCSFCNNLISIEDIAERIDDNFFITGKLVKEYPEDFIRNLSKIKGDVYYY